MLHGNSCVTNGLHPRGVVAVVGLLFAVLCWLAGLPSREMLLRSVDCMTIMCPILTIYVLTG